MTGSRLKFVLIVMGVISLLPNIARSASLAKQAAYPDTTSQSAIANVASNERESIFPAGSRPLWLSNFTWGVDIGSSIDLRGYDMSTLDLDVMLGYKSSFIRTLGVGAGVHRSFGKKNNFIPLYLVFRSSFRTKPSLFFFNMRAGYAFSTIGEGASRGGAMAAVGVGINLAMSKRFQSHILLSYCYYHINGHTRKESSFDSKYIDLARISFGVNF